LRLLVKRLIEIHHAHFLNTDLWNVQTPAPRPHFGVVVDSIPITRGFPSFSSRRNPIS